MSVEIVKVEELKALLGSKTFSENGELCGEGLKRDGGEPGTVMYEQGLEAKEGSEAIRPRTRK